MSFQGANIITIYLTLTKPGKKGWPVRLYAMDLNRLSTRVAFKAVRRLREDDCGPHWLVIHVYIINGDVADHCVLSQP